MTPHDFPAQLAQVPQWHIEHGADVAQLTRVFTVERYLDGLDFAHRLGLLADAADHHPALLIEWCRVTVRWWTHDIGGIDERDFVMARETDALFASLQK